MLLLSREKKPDNTTMLNEFQTADDLLKRTARRILVGHSLIYEKALLYDEQGQFAATNLSDNMLCSLRSMLSLIRGADLGAGLNAAQVEAEVEDELRRRGVHRGLSDGPRAPWSTAQRDFYH